MTRGVLLYEGLHDTAGELVWTNNASERGVKPAKRHQAVSGY
jgi:hypothetical protein